METNIGNVICERRRKLGMTQEQLAEAVGVSTPAVSKWETCSSCPDVALLAPIARTLDTDVNTLLSFTPTLPQEGLLVLLKELRRLAEGDGSSALGRMREALRRYPNDVQLRFQLACFAMALPQFSGWAGEDREAAWALAEEGLEFARRHGDQRQRFLAAHMLAALLLSKDELDRAEELLDKLPALPMSPQALYTLLYQKRGDRDKARASALAQLASGATAVLNSLQALASPDCAETGEEARKALQAYRAVADALGYSPSQTDILLAAHELQGGRTDQAMERLLKSAHALMEQEVPHLLFGPGVPEEQYAAYRLNLGRMLRDTLLADPAFDGVRQDPRYLEALRALAPEK